MTTDAIDRAAIHQLKGILSQKKLAEASGVSVRTVRYIQAEAEPKTPTQELLEIILGPETDKETYITARRDLAIIGPLESFGNARVLERMAQYSEDLAPWDCNKGHARLDAMEEEVRILKQLAYMFGIIYHGPKPQRRPPTDPERPGHNFFYRQSGLAHTRVIGWALEAEEGNKWTGYHITYELDALLIRLERSIEYYRAMAETHEGKKRAAIPWVNLSVRSGDIFLEACALMFRIEEGIPGPYDKPPKLPYKSFEQICIELQICNKDTEKYEVTNL